MPFQSIADRLPNLPYVLAGPILRRVESDMVNVWFATRRNGTATLKVWNADQILPAAPILQSSAQTFLKLGDNLFIGCIQANQFVGANTTLYSDVLYKYDIEFDFDSGGPNGGLSVPQIINSEGQLENVLALPGFDLPTFVIPNSNLNKVHVLHGSCRKPHGEGLDALRGVAKILNAYKDDPLTRPQALFLTGDQIYADDVSANLLFMINDAKKTLIGWDEPFPITFVEKENKALVIPGPEPTERWPPVVYVSGGPLFERYQYDKEYKNVGSYHVPIGDIYQPIPAPLEADFGGLTPPQQLDSALFSIKPSRRSKLIKYSAGFTVDNADDGSVQTGSDAGEDNQSANRKGDKVALAGNHLMLFGEFAMMYLFVWSSVLWPEDQGDMPDFLNIYNPASNGANRTQHKSRDFKDIIAAYTGINLQSADGVYQSTFLRHVLNDNETLWDFRQTNIQVRLALANIATYMVFDDHEVTDDLFLNFEWCYRVLGAPKKLEGSTWVDDSEFTGSPTNSLGRGTGRRIISNGLTCIAIFQYWGNYRNIGLQGSTNPSPFAQVFYDMAQIVDSPNNDERKTRMNALAYLVLPEIRRIYINDYPEGVIDALHNDFVGPDDYNNAVTGWENCETYHLKSEINWSYDLPISYGGTIKIRYLFLDIRTKRSFHVRQFNYQPTDDNNVPVGAPHPAINPREYAGLISISELSNLPLGNAPENCLFLISGAPVFGHPVVEGLAEGLLLANSGKDWQQIRATEQYDAEAWSYNRKIFEYFLKKLSNQPRVVILSGDVHYGFSTLVNYWNKRSGANQRTVIAQLTSSSFKNETSETRITENIPAIPTIHFGWSRIHTNDILPEIQGYTLSDLFDHILSSFSSTSTEAATIFDSVENFKDAILKKIPINGDNPVVLDSLYLHTIGLEYNDFTLDQDRYKSIAELVKALYNKKYDSIIASVKANIQVIERAVKLSTWLYSQCDFLTAFKSNFITLLSGLVGTAIEQFSNDIELYYRFLRDNGPVIFTSDWDSRLTTVDEVILATKNFFNDTNSTQEDLDLLYQDFIAYLTGHPSDYPLINSPSGAWVFNVDSFWPLLFDSTKYQSFATKWNTINDILDWLYEHTDMLFETAHWLKSEDSDVNKRYSTWKDTPLAVKFDWPLALVRRFVGELPADWFYQAQPISDERSPNSKMLSAISFAGEGLRVSVTENVSIATLKLLKSFIISELIAIRYVGEGAKWKNSPFYRMVHYHNTLDMINWKEVNTITSYQNLRNRMQTHNPELYVAIVALDTLVQNHPEWHQFIRVDAPISFVELMVDKSPSTYYGNNLGVTDFVATHLGVTGAGDAQTENQDQIYADNRSVFLQIIRDELSLTTDQFYACLKKAVSERQISINNLSVAASSVNQLLLQLMTGAYPKLNLDVSDVAGRNNLGQIIFKTGTKASFSHDIWMDIDVDLIPGMELVHQAMQDDTIQQDVFFLPYVSHSFDNFELSSIEPYHGQ